MFSRSPFDREIWRLALPALGSLAAEPLYVLVDTAVVGHLGRAPLGGLAIAGALLTTGFWLFNFLAYGMTAMVARALGAGDRAAGARLAMQGLWVAVVLGGVLLAAGVALSGPAVRLMGADATIEPFALTYLRISVLGAPAVLVMLVGMGYSRGLQDTRTPFTIAIAANVVNLVLELVLIYGFDAGIAGSAWATVVAQTGAAAVYLRILLRDVRAHGSALRPDVAAMRVLGSVGGHLIVRTGSLLAAITVATAVAARMGAVSVGAHQIAFQIWTFLALVLDAIAIAGQAMVGRFLGAGDADSARAASRRMIGWGLSAGVVFALLLIAVRPVLPALFTGDPAVRATVGTLLWFVAALQPLGAYVFVLDGVLIGAGDVRYLAWAMAVVSFVVFIPAALWISAAGMGISALWAVLGVLTAGRAVALGARFAGRGWQVIGAR